MAMINCSECSKEVSDKAASCPNCGVLININTNQQRVSRLSKTICIALTAFIIIGVGVFIGIRMYNKDLRISEEKERIEVERIATEERIEKELQAESERLKAERIAMEEKIQKEIQYENDIITASALMRYYGLIGEIQLVAISRIWSETISNSKNGVGFNDPDTGRTMYFKEFNDTIKWFLGLSSIKKITNALSENDDIMAEYMILLQNPPEKFYDAYRAFLDMYEIYVQTSELAQLPSGSLVTFNSTRNTLSANFSSVYARVKVLLPTVEKRVEELGEDDI